MKPGLVDECPRRTPDRSLPYPSLSLSVPIRISEQIRIGLGHLCQDHAREKIRRAAAAEMNA
jgi:hypothetical protein